MNAVPPASHRAARATRSRATRLPATRSRATRSRATGSWAIGALATLLWFGGCAAPTGGSWAFWSRQSGKSAAEPAVLDPQQAAEMQLALGRTAEQQEQWTRAAAIYRQLLDHDPKHAEAAHRLAILCDRQGDFEQSAQWFQRALKLKPGDPELFTDVGYSLASQGRLQEAEINLRQALAISPSHPRAHNHLGVVLAKRGEIEQALASFRRAHCSLAEAHTNVAVALAMAHRLDDAQHHLRYAQSLPGASPDAQQRLAGLESLIARHPGQIAPPPTVADPQMLETPQVAAQPPAAQLR